MQVAMKVLSISYDQSHSCRFAFKALCDIPVDGRCYCTKGSYLFHTQGSAVQHYPVGTSAVLGNLEVSFSDC
jgi:hypothetical protein